MRPVRRVAALALALVPALGVAALPTTPATADVTTLPGTLSTATVGTSSFSVAVPPGVTPRAITGVLTMPAVVNNGVVTFRVNGRLAEQVDATLYQKVTIPVTAADVIADGTILLTVASQGPAIGNICRPAAGEATLRKIALDYRGEEVPPTSPADFFPPSATRIDVLIPPDADAQVVEAGLTAVASLAARYGPETPVELNSLDQIPTSGVASQRIVVLTAGSSIEVDTQVTAGPSTGGVPTLTIASNGEALTEAAADLGPAGSLDVTRPDEPRRPDLDQSLADFGVDDAVLSGYGTSVQRLRLVQDQFATPVASMQLRLRGATSALADGEQARLDVRVGDDLLASTNLDDSGVLDLTVDLPARLVAPVVDVDVVLNATTSTGTVCAAAGVPPFQVDIDAADSSVTAVARVTEDADFGLFPQLLGGVLPVAVRSPGDAPLEGAIQASRLIAALQRAAATPFDIQLVRPETLLGVNRSGLLVGATAEDAAAVGAPVLLTAIRPAGGSSLALTSQSPYAVLQAVADEDRYLLMLGGWAPEEDPVPETLVREVVTFASVPGWSSLRGDLLVADGTSTPVLGSSGTSAAPADPATDDSSLPWLWLAVGAALLLQLVLFTALLRRQHRAAENAGYDLPPVTPAKRVPAAQQAPVTKAKPGATRPPARKPPKKR